MAIEKLLEKLKQHDSDRKFSQDDANRLISIIALVPCHLEGRLLTINLSWEYRHLFSKSWEQYYTEAVEGENECWNADGVVHLHLTAATLYSNNQQTSQASQAVKKAFVLAPQNWRVIDAYISKTKPIISEQEAIPLIHQIADLAPNDSLAFYRQGFLFERYANQFQKEEYKQAAVKAYQQSISLGLDEVTSLAVVEDAKGAFVRLSQTPEY